MAGKLLIVDDEPGLLRVMQLHAEGAGWKVTTLDRTERAIETFLALGPDVVVLDMVMPETDGLDVLNEMLLSEIPARFVVVSGFGAAYLRLAEGVAVFHGVDRVASLKKPFRKADFIAALGAPSDEPPEPLLAA